MCPQPRLERGRGHPVSDLPQRGGQQEDDHRAEPELHRVPVVRHGVQSGAQEGAHRQNSGLNQLSSVSDKNISNFVNSI